MVSFCEDSIRGTVYWRLHKLTHVYDCVHISASEIIFLNGVVIHTHITADQGP